MLKAAALTIQEHSNWPTYPQLYVSGELVGGADIVLEMAAAGELQEVLVEFLLPQASILRVTLSAAAEDVLATLRPGFDEPKALRWLRAAAISSVQLQPPNLQRLCVP